MFSVLQRTSDCLHTRLGVEQGCVTHYFASLNRYNADAAQTANSSVASTAISCFSILSDYINLSTYKILGYSDSWTVRFATEEQGEGLCGWRPITAE